MKHLFVPYALALLAKEKGFDEPCFGGYEQEGKEFKYYKPNDFLKTSMGLQHMEHGNHVNNNLIDAHCTTPLYQQLVDWFIETKKIYIVFDVEEECWMIYSKIKEGFLHESAGHDSKQKALTEAFKLI